MKTIYVILFKDLNLNNGTLYRKVIMDNTTSLKIEGFEYFLDYVSATIDGIDTYIFLKNYPNPLMITLDENFENLVKGYDFKALDLTLEKVVRAKLFSSRTLVETLVYFSLVVLATALLTYVITIHAYGFVNIALGAVFPAKLIKLNEKDKKQRIKIISSAKSQAHTTFPQISFAEEDIKTIEDTQNLGAVIKRCINSQYVKKPFILSIAYQIPQIRNMLAYALYRGHDEGLKMLKNLKDLVKNYPRSVFDINKNLLRG